MQYVYAHTAAADPLPLESTSKMSQVLRASKALLVLGKTAATAWADYRGKKTPEALILYVTAIQDILHQMFIVAKALGMDLTGFRTALTSADEIQARVAKGALAFKDISPSSLGKVTFAMRDVLLSTREMLGDAQDVDDSDFGVMPLDLVIFGSDMSIVLSALWVVFKQLRGDPKGILKARNESMRFFKVLSESALEFVPEGGSAEETYEPIVLAATVKKAVALFRKDPGAGWKLLGSLDQRMRVAHIPWSLEAHGGY
ncbi:MAG: hypothetical protein WC322_03015 [Candidatus Paceibacterota bacterium]|jgi:hypothetical protein